MSCTFSQNVGEMLHLNSLALCIFSPLPRRTKDTFTVGDLQVNPGRD